MGKEIFSYQTRFFLLLRNFVSPSARSFLEESLWRTEIITVNRTEEKQTYGLRKLDTSPPKCPGKLKVAKLKKNSRSYTNQHNYINLTMGLRYELDNGNIVGLQYLVLRYSIPSWLRQNAVAWRKLGPVIIITNSNDVLLPKLQRSQPNNCFSPPYTPAGLLWGNLSLVLYRAAVFTSYV